MPTALGLLPWTWVDAFPRSPFPAVKRGFLTYRLDCEALAAEGRPAEAAGRQDLAGSIPTPCRAEERRVFAGQGLVDLCCGE